MTTPDDNSTQEPNLFSDDERPLIVSEVFERDNLSERREAFAALLIQLRERLGEQGEGWPQVAGELERLLEETFKNSETYHLALALYTRRFSLIGLREPAEVMRQLLDEQLSPPPKDCEGQATAAAQSCRARVTPQAAFVALSKFSTLHNESRSTLDDYGCAKWDAVSALSRLRIVATFA